MKRWIIQKHNHDEVKVLANALKISPLVAALLISRGDWSVFLTRPLSAVLIAAAAGLLVLAVLPTLRKKRDEVFVESEG